jgi:VanZ family protein
VEDVKRWLPVVLYAALIFHFSSTPGHELPHWELMVHDKLLHTLEYAGFGFLLARAFGARRWWLAILVGAAYGVSDEFHQTFTANRFGNDPFDMTADLVGSAIGTGVWVAYTRLLRPRLADGTKDA